MLAAPASKALRPSSRPNSGHRNRCPPWPPGVTRHCYRPTQQPHALCPDAVTRGGNTAPFIVFPHSAFFSKTLKKKAFHKTGTPDATYRARKTNTPDITGPGGPRLRRTQAFNNNKSEATFASAGQQEQQTGRTPKTTGRASTKTINATFAATRQRCQQQQSAPAGSHPGRERDVRQQCTPPRLEGSTTRTTTATGVPPATKTIAGETNSRMDYCFEYEAVGYFRQHGVCRLRCVFRAIAKMKKKISKDADLSTCTDRLQGEPSPAPLFYGRFPLLALSTVLCHRPLFHSPPVFHRHLFAQPSPF